MILVTGAAGKTGRAVVRALVAKSARIRALVHRTGQAGVLKDLGAEEVAVGDMRDRATMDLAMRGVRAVCYICPNMSPHERAMGTLALAAAATSGIERFVYHSVLHPQAEAMPHHWQKMRVEEAIFESKLYYTILQPAAYMQNVAAYRQQIARDGVYAVPYAVQSRLSLVDLEDVAEVARTVLTEAGHVGAIYELSGPDALSSEDIAAEIESAVGRPVRAEAVSRESWRQLARADGVGEDTAEMLLSMFEYYDRHGLCGNPRVLGWLLGRLPTTFAGYLEREKSDWVGAFQGSQVRVRAPAGA